MLSLKNTAHKYGLVSQAFHWVMAVMMVGMVALGSFMEEMHDSPVKFKIFDLHKSIGILIVILLVARLAWFFISKRPEEEKTLTKLEAIVSKGIYIVLYALMLIIPLSGWAISSSGGYPVSFFGLFELPSLLGESEEVKEFFEEAHEFLAFSMLGLAGLHAAAALKHHFISKDNVLRRMLPFA